LKAKGRISFRGSFCLVKEKAFETGGENSNLKKCFSQSYSYTFDYLQMNFEKTLKRFAKTKQVVQMWSKMLNKRKQSIHSYSFVIRLSYWFKFQVTYALTICKLVRFCTLYICFGLCWHQSPKRGRLKGK
jgi:hypothetical protein